MLVDAGSGVPLTDIPQFRYIGSKHNLLRTLMSVIVRENIKGESLFDVFSGSAAVGRYFKKIYSIISNDNLYFSYVLQRAFIVLNQYPKFENLDIPDSNSLKAIERINNILDLLNKDKGVEGFITKNYTPISKTYADGLERKYFTEKNGKKIDGVREKVENWHQDGLINDDEYFYLIASLLHAVQKVSNIAGTYGAYNKFWDPRTPKPLTLKFIKVINSRHEHNAYNEDSFDLIKKIKADIVYIDPPYNTRQYIANFHVLETIAKYDNPKISGKTGMRAYNEKDKSLLCSKTFVYDALLKLLNGIQGNHIILSYNSEGILSKDQINEIYEKAGFEGIKLLEFPYRRFKSQSNSTRKKIKEYVFVSKGLT